MKRPTRTPASFATVSVKSQTVLARAKRGAKLIDKGSGKIDNPFASFSEWSSEADEKACAKL
jgi:hypothetical protein